MHFLNAIINENYYTVSKEGTIYSPLKNREISAYERKYCNMTATEACKLILDIYHIDISESNLNKIQYTALPLIGTSYSRPL